ncbi:MAG: hypothetical protein QOI04_1030 [Verrucomicrobiota bacterium]|jgi:hypothetical protein
MPLKTRLLVFLLCLLVVVAAIIFLAPTLVSGAVRVWIWREARLQGLKVELGKIDAPLLRPVVIRGIKIDSRAPGAFSIHLDAARAELQLNLAGIFSAARGRVLRKLSLAQTHADIRRVAASPTARRQFDWTVLHALLPDNLDLSGAQLRVENGNTLVEFYDVTFTASEIEAGHFAAREVAINSPWFRKRFEQLRGATAWQDDRLTIGAINLARGLDLEAIVMDLAHLPARRIGFEVKLDAFGGKFRGTISSEEREKNRTWDAAGSAAEISLSQMSDALGLVDRTGGAVHACKFTFRGDARDISHATASIWADVTGFTWRDRSADTIMLGASFYNRTVQVQQLYVKQHKNQLTLSGESAMPAKPSDWLSPDFRGDISATINDLGDFARLFGAQPNDFSGTIAIEGTVNARERKLGGHLIVNGHALTIFRAPVELFAAELNLVESVLEIEDLELQRTSDFLYAQGKIDISHEHDYSGTISATVSDVAKYLSAVSAPDAKAIPANMQATVSAAHWNLYANINVPGSSPINLAANFPLPIGGDILNVPMKATLDFPGVSLADAPRLWSKEIFSAGNLGGKISITQTLQHPRIKGEAHLTDAKLHDVAIGLDSISGQLTFIETMASLDFLNASNKDVDLALRGEVDFSSLDDLRIKFFTTAPIFDVTPRPLDCVGKIDIAATGATLAPALTQIELRGGLFGNDWRMRLPNALSQSSGALDLNEAAREIPFCFGEMATEKRLTLAVHPRPSPIKASRPRRSSKR